MKATIARVEQLNNGKAKCRCTCAQQMRHGHTTPPPQPAPLSARDTEQGGHVPHTLRVVQCQHRSTCVHVQGVHSPSAQGPRTGGVGHGGAAARLHLKHMTSGGGVHKQEGKLVNKQASTKQTVTHRRPRGCTPRTQTRCLLVSAPCVPDVDACIAGEAPHTHHPPYGS